jgi:hypothetical protein
MKKIVSYGSPKYYQPKYNKFATVPGKKKFPCKKLKGNHVWGEWKRIVLPWNPKHLTGFWERHCTGCNKKETWLAPTLPGPYLKFDLTAIPPENL